MLFDINTAIVIDQVWKCYIFLSFHKDIGLSWWVIANKEKFSLEYYLQIRLLCTVFQCFAVNALCCFAWLNYSVFLGAVLLLRDTTWLATSVIPTCLFLFLWKIVLIKSKNNFINIIAEELHHYHYKRDKIDYTPWSFHAGSTNLSSPISMKLFTSYD